VILAPASASRSTAMICSSVYFLALTLPQD
jgi:hypothetical protein